jgi:hypothetical protein
MAMNGSFGGFALLLMAGCSAEGPAHSCQGTQAECLFASMTFHDFDREPGPALTLSAVPTDAIRELAVRDAAPDGSQSGVRVVGPGSLSFASSGGGMDFELAWDDEFGCRPAFCFSPCPKNARCFGSSVCSPAVRDGLTNGMSHHWLTFEKPPEQTVDFILLIAPVSGPGCPEDVAPLIEEAATEITVGPPERVGVRVPGTGPDAPPDDTPPSSDPPSTCGDGLHASTAACTPLGTSGLVNTCISRAEYQSATGMSLPTAAAPDGTTGCMDTQRGVVVKPCALGSTCRVASACGGGSTLGGVCAP